MTKDAFALWWSGPREVPQTEAAAREAWSAAVAAERERCAEVEADCERLRGEKLLLTNALWKACGDDPEIVNACIESQRA